jgi:hypothetical protein
MEGKILITELFRLLYDGGPQHLIRTHPLCTRTMRGNRTGEVLPDQLADARVAIKQVADSFKLLGPGMLNTWGHEGHLNLLFLAHFGVAPFSVFVVISIDCTLSFITAYR